MAVATPEQAKQSLDAMLLAGRWFRRSLWGLPLVYGLLGVIAHFAGYRWSALGEVINWLWRIATILAPSVWLFRASRVGESFGRSKTIRFPAGFAAAAFVIPLMNLALPFLILRDLWKSAQFDEFAPVTTLAEAPNANFREQAMIEKSSSVSLQAPPLGWFWAFWLLQGFFDSFWFVQLTIPFALVSVLAAVCGTRSMQRIEAAFTERYQRMLVAHEQYTDRAAFYQASGADTLRAESSSTAQTEEGSSAPSESAHAEVSSNQLKG